MALISNSKAGRKDGGYTRLFGNETLGALFSRIHATVISSGTELEKELKALSPPLPTNLDNFLKNPSNGTFLADKKVIKKSSLASDKEPDFLIFKVSEGNKSCQIIELKDGDTFDTKKAQGEIDLLEKFQNHISSKIQFSTSIHVCCFNQNDKSKIISGFKNTLTEEQAMTGQEFCEILGIDYNALLNKRTQHQTENIEFFIEELLKIETTRTLIKEKLK